MGARTATRATLLSIALLGAFACSALRGNGRTARLANPRSCSGTWILTVYNPGDFEYQVFSGEKVIALVGRGTHTFTVETPTHSLKRVTGDAVDRRNTSERRIYATSRMDCRPR